MTRSFRATCTLAGTLLAAALTALPAAVASAATPGAVVSIDAPDGIAADAPTSVTLHGTGFQVVPGGFGGIYVLFGWVDDPAAGTWRPSAGGTTGTNLRYAVDEASQQNAGHQLFVAFPGASTAVEANGGQLAEDGSWSATLTVPGARFTVLDASGATVELDCTVVTCGVVTIGAHGVENANNETFTPVAFADTADATATSEASAEPTPEPTAEPVAAPVDEQSPAPTADASASGEGDGGSALPVVVGVVAVLAAASAAVVVVRRRRRADDSRPTT